MKWNVERFPKVASGRGIAEATTGQVTAYMIPWSNALRVNNQLQKGAFVPLDIVKMRTIAVR